jgi:glutamine synthetase type III
MTVSKHPIESFFEASSLFSKLFIAKNKEEQNKAMVTLENYIKAYELELKTKQTLTQSTL